MKQFIFALTLAPTFLSAQDVAIEPNVLLRPEPASPGLSGSAHVGYDSRYFTEGRDDLDGDALITTSFEIAYENLSFGTWLGVSPEQNYDELQLSAAYTGELGDFEYYLSWTYLTFFSFFPDSDHDNEVGFGVAYTGLPYDVSIAIDGSYSLEADGTFLELSLAKSFELTDQLSADLTGIFGVNQGFVSDGHDGANHLALSAALNYALTDNLTFSVHATQSLALDRDRDREGDETLIDFFHVGGGFQLSF